MIKNYFKITLRNLWKYKGFTAINVIGLAMGIGCFIVIAMYVFDELSYDRYNEKADRIYRINSDIRFGGTDQIMAESPDPMGEILKNDYPEVEEFVRFYNNSGDKLIKKGHEFINETRVAHVDSTLFDVFTLPSIAGNPHTALTSPNTVVLTESAAKRYFGSAEKALGKTLETNDFGSTLYKVTAVIEDVPENSHFDFDFFFSMANVDYEFGDFLSFNFNTYVVLAPGTDYKAFNKKFEEVIKKYALPQASQYIDIKSMEQFEQAGNKWENSLIPLTDIHLRSSRSGELGVNGNMQYIYIFSAAALFILLIACINFMNLTTARSSGRAREVGIRKVLGTKRKMLVWQFLTESVLIAFIALILGIGLTWASLPWFNDIAGKQMSIETLFTSRYLIFLILLPFIVGGLAGAYPAFFLSSFRPVAALQGKNPGHKKNNLRNVLVVFQFSTSMILIVGTIVIYQQLRHIQTANVGFTKDHVLIVKNTGLSDLKKESLKSEIEQFTDVKSASFGSFLPVGSSPRSSTTFSTGSVMTETNALNTQFWRISYNYIPTMGMKMIEGRNFSRSFGSDSLAVILNEAAVKTAGIKNPVGKKLYRPAESGEPSISYTIVGVVKNFNFESLRQNVGPLVMRLGNNSGVSAYRFNTSDVSDLISAVEDRYRTMAPGMPFDYYFLDDSFNNMYRQEQRIGKVALTFSFLAVVIACLGLFGLATYIAEQRTKEIGIRKVLGASVVNIITMLSTDFIKLVVTSFLIAAPVAWWFMHQWLQDFAFRIHLSLWIFVATGIIALLIALVTLSFRAIKAAIANPVNSLRNE